MCKVSTEAVGSVPAATLYRWGDRSEGNRGRKEEEEENRVEGEGGMNLMGERGRLGPVPSGRYVNPCDAAILPQRALLLDNIRGAINRPLICERES